MTVVTNSHFHIKTMHSTSIVFTFTLSSAVLRFVGSVLGEACAGGHSTRRQVRRGADDTRRRALRATQPDRGHRGTA